jgi:hypothetical protein
MRPLSRSRTISSITAASSRSLRTGCSTAPGPLELALLERGGGGRRARGPGTTVLLTTASASFRLVVKIRLETARLPIVT